MQLPDSQPRGEIRRRIFASRSLGGMRRGREGGHGLIGLDGGAEIRTAARESRLAWFDRWVRRVVQTNVEAISNNLARRSIVRINVGGPVKGLDQRWRVTLQPDDVPWPITFYFVPLLAEGGTEAPTCRVDTKKQSVQIDPGDVDEWLHVGFQIGDSVDPEAGPSRSGETAELSPANVTQITSRYIHWLNAARNYLALEMTKGRESSSNTARPRRSRLTDDWLRLIATEFEQRSAAGQPAITEIAKAHQVQMSTASRWVSRAREREFLPRTRSRRNVRS